MFVTMGSAWVQHIILFNAAAEQMLGHSSREIMGQPLDTLIPERLRANQAQITVILRDISERKRSNESAALLAAVVQSSADAS